MLLFGFLIFTSTTLLCANNVPLWILVSAHVTLRSPMTTKPGDQCCRGGDALLVLLANPGHVC